MLRVLLCLCLAACALAKNPPQSPARQTNLGLGIHTVALPNGLRVVLVQDPHASEVQVTMRYRVGAADDGEHPGIAHFVEHLMFEQMLGGQTLMAHLEENATYNNAFTTYDGTTYISRARPELLDKLLSIEAVRLGFRCTSITDSAFAREREVVTQEVRLDERRDDLMTAIHAAVFSKDHPYGHPIGGTVGSVSAITREQACAFADAYYTPGNAVLVISGNVSAARANAALHKFVAKLPKRIGAATKIVAQAPALPKREAPAPVDEKILVVSWPLPTDPYAGLTTREIAAAAAEAVNQEVKGRVHVLPVGDVRAPVFAFAIEPHADETIEQLTATVQKTLDRLPRDLAARDVPQEVYEALRQRMIYGSTRRSKTAATATPRSPSTSSPGAIRPSQSRPSFRRCASSVATRPRASRSDTSASRRRASSCSSPGTARSAAARSPRTSRRTTWGSGAPYRTLLARAHPTRPRRFRHRRSRRACCRTACASC